MTDRRPELEDWLELLTGLTDRFPWLAHPAPGSIGEDPPSRAEKWADRLVYLEERESAAASEKGRSPWLMVDLEAAEPRLGVREGAFLDVLDIAREVRRARHERLVRLDPPPPAPDPERELGEVSIQMPTGRRGFRAVIAATAALRAEGQLPDRTDDAGNRDPELTPAELELVRDRAHALLAGDPAALDRAWSRTLFGGGGAMPEAPSDDARRCACGDPKGTTAELCPACEERGQRLRRAG